MPDALCEIPDLSADLHRLLAQVPAGRVTTCGALAAALGSAKAALWVGHFAMNHHHRPGCCCHRIVRAGGKLGPYIVGGEEAKLRLLASEGVEVRDGRIDLPRFGHESFVSEKPLERLRQVQTALQNKVSLRPRRRIPRLLGGVDVSYCKPAEAVAAYALVETATGNLVWSTTLCRRVGFPYISTFLSFRELPILLELLAAVKAAKRLSQVLLVDGTGTLHPRRMGIAAHLGVVASLPTVGVIKKLLCGRVDIEGMRPQESRPVLQDGQLAAVALRPTAGSRRPIFVSPGHRLDVAYSERLVRTLLCGHRLPEPLYWADRLSRKAARCG